MSREQNIRVDDDDINAVDELRDEQFDNCVSRGYVVRKACEAALDDDEDLGVGL